MKPAEKTPRSQRSRRSSSCRRPVDHSIVARSVRCRCGQVAARVDEQPQPAVEALQHGPRRQQPHPRGGEFDRERQSVERLAHRDDRRRVRRRQREVGLHGASALDEELHGGGAPPRASTRVGRGGIRRRAAAAPRRRARRGSAARCDSSRGRPRPARARRAGRSRARHPRSARSCRGR